MDAARTQNETKTSIKTHVRSVYSEKELKKLKEFVEVIKNDQARSELVCWGDHSEFSRGY